MHYFLLPKILKERFLNLGLRIFNHIDWFTIFNNLIHLQHLKKYKILAKNKIIHSTFQYRITKKTFAKKLYYKYISDFSYIHKIFFYRNKQPSNHDSAHKTIYMVHPVLLYNLSNLHILLSILTL